MYALPWRLGGTAGLSTSALCAFGRDDNFEVGEETAGLSAAPSASSEFGRDDSSGVGQGTAGLSAAALCAFGRDDKVGVGLA